MENNQELREKLTADALDKGICLPGYERMLDSDIDGLVDYYVANPDWCLERGFPTLSVLKKHFSDCGDKGVFVNKTFHGEVLNDLQTYIFHNCKGTIKVGLNIEKGIIPMLYLANRCRLRIIGMGDIKPKRKVGQSIVPIYEFGDNAVSARDNVYVKFVHHTNDLI